MSPLSLIPNPAAETASQRCMLWIDGGGAFDLLWPPSNVIIGSPDASASGERLELLAPISRQQMNLSYADGQYRVIPVKATELNGRTLEGPTVLTSGDGLSVEPGVQWTFRQSSPLSATSVLQLKSAHRWTSGADAVVFLDRLCLVGPDDDCPMRVRHYEQRLILFQRRGQLFLKGMGDALDQAQLLSPGQAVDVHGLNVRLSPVTGSSEKRGASKR